MPRNSRHWDEDLLVSPLSRAQRAAARPGQSLPAHTAGAASQGVKSFSLGEWRNIVIVRVWVGNIPCSFCLVTVFYAGLGFAKKMQMANVFCQ